MRLVDDEQCALACAQLDSVCEVDDIAVHREHRVGHDQRAPRATLAQPGREVIEIAVPVDGDFDGENAEVHEDRPKAACQEADEGSEHADDQPDSGDDEKPPIRHGLERPHLVAERKQLLRYAKAEPKLCLPVHDRARKPADQRAQSCAREQAEDEAGDRSREHRASDRKPDEEVVHHARRLTRDRTMINAMRKAPGTAKP